MTTPTWQAGTLYSPGAIVQRSTAPAVVAQAPVNADFESGDIGWTKESPWTVGTFDNTFTGAYSARCNGVKGTFRIYNETPVPVSPGMSVTASCMVRRADGNMKGQVQLEWLDSLSASLEIVDGTLIDYSEDKWKTSTVTSTAPAGAAYMRIGAKCVMNRTDANLHVDSFQWNYAYSPPIDALVFTAVQADAGYSGATEPVWPDTLGVQVVDNEVTWEAIDSSTVTWEASPILVSGPTEPVFPTAIGDTVSDNTIIWTAVSRRVEDENCPNGPLAIMAASKIFCADDDIVAFCATVNPLDWTSSDDAGYLPFGLQAYGSMGGVTAMGLYRGNLLSFNAAAFQMWQVDPDPQAMALLDSAPIACTFPRTLSAFQNDLVFLSPAGVRNISIAGASTNLQAGGMGEPVDPIVVANVREQAYEPHSMFIPQYGQYWLVFGPEVLVMTVLGVKSISWSRYVFPIAIDNLALLDGVVYMRCTDGAILRFDPDLTADDVYCQPLAVTLTAEADVDEVGFASPPVSLSWTAATYDTGISGYIVLRSLNGGAYVELDTVDSSTLTYLDNDVLSDGTYRYGIVAIPVPTTDSALTAINSPISNTETVVFSTVTAPELTAYLTEGDGVLSWTASVSGAGSISSYQLWRAEDGGTPHLLATTDAATRDYLDYALELAVAYTYYVIAVDSTGAESPASNVEELLPGATYTPASWVNPGAEDDVTDTYTHIGWTATVGNFVSMVTAGFGSGDQIFRGSAAPRVTMHQDYDVVDTGCPTTAVDAGNVLAVVDWLGGTWEQSTNDQPRVNMYFYDGTMTLLDSYLGAWRNPVTFIDGYTRRDTYQDAYPVPPNTRTIRVELDGNRRAGSNNDARFDDVYPSLRTT